MIVTMICHLNGKSGATYISPAFYKGSGQQILDRLFSESNQGKIFRNLPSMSAGDIVILNNAIYLVQSTGFAKLEDNDLRAWYAMSSFERSDWAFHSEAVRG